MPLVSPQQLVSLHSSPNQIRNICILAHVDHGKTSLTDALLATNGIISPKLAGKVRYLDSRPDEQLRGITMESSAISLYFSMRRRRETDSQSEQSEQGGLEEYLINLIDSPGHIDFQSEVSTASRLCDGAVVLVDVVEGVCSQTVTVLRQAWVEKLKPLLVINKIDRLVTELKMSPAEAYVHMSKLLEQVNAVMGSFFQGERMEEDLRWREKMEERVNARLQERDSNTALIDGDAEFEEKDDEDIYFAPEKNNVIFSSALDGWAFTVKQFAALYEKKLGIKRSVLEKVLWGDFYLDPKTKRVLGSKHLKGRALKPMFVQLVLENIWAVYEATVGGPNGKGDPTLLNKILTSLSITIPPHILKGRVPHTLLTTLFSNWLPLSTALLVSVIEHLPSPPAAQAARMPALLDSLPGADYISSEIRRAVTEFGQEEERPIVAFVSKMVAVKESELPRNRRPVGGSLSAEEARELARKKRAEIAKVQAAESASDGVSSMTGSLKAASITDETATTEPEKEDPEHLIGFARIYSGTLKTGSEIYVLPPKYSPAHPQKPPPIRVTVEALFLLMGRSLEALASVPAGTIFGIQGLSSAILKSGTLCTVPNGAPNFAGLVGTQIAPIVRVALEPEHPADLDKMIAGLKMLERSDPCAIYEVLESGEHVLATAGELHLERCLNDLRERFAKCEIQAGEPIVPYKESIVNAPSVTGEVAVGPRGTSIVEVGKSNLKIRIRVLPLPPKVTAFLIRSSNAVRRLMSETKDQDVGDDVDEAVAEIIGAAGEPETGNTMSSAEFEKGLRKAFEKEKGEYPEGMVDRILTFGPRRVGPNILVDGTDTRMFGKGIFSHNNPQTQEKSTGLSAADLYDKIVNAFQLETYQGPLCHEPIQGVAVSIESYEINLGDDDSSSAREKLTRLTGELIKSVRSGIRLGLLEWSPRLWLAVYRCEIQASTEVLGRVYPTLTRRHSHILSEVLSEASNVYTITALLPIHSSFGFADEIRKRTSGGASAQLAFHGFEMLDQDPFWVPATEEEIEDLGDTADKENRAKALVDAVRKRKGLLVVGRTLDAEKERNMKR